LGEEGDQCKALSSLRPTQIICNKRRITVENYNNIDYLKAILYSMVPEKPPKEFVKSYIERKRSSFPEKPELSDSLNNINMREGSIYRRINPFAIQSDVVEEYLGLYVYKGKLFNRIFLAKKVKQINDFLDQHEKYFKEYQNHETMILNEAKQIWEQEWCESQILKGRIAFGKGEQ
jgi:hypothetical protein